MITVNISGFEEIRNKIASIDMDALCCDVAIKLRDKINKRVHEGGLASDGSPIGTYSEGYMKVRTGNYSDAARYKRGANKGNFKEKKSQKKAEAGVFTRGKRKGQPRPVYNRSTDRNVILSLSSEMEQDFADTQPIQIPNGYGIGFSKNDKKGISNYNKAIWNEKRYGKPIWSLSKEENQLAQDIVKKYVDEINN